MEAWEDDDDVIAAFESGCRPARTPEAYRVAIVHDILASTYHPKTDHVFLQDM